MKTGALTLSSYQEQHREVGFERKLLVILLMTQGMIGGCQWSIKFGIFCN